MADGLDILLALFESGKEKKKPVLAYQGPVQGSGVVLTLIPVCVVMVRGLGIL